MTTAPHSLTYRPELDGIRALAVLLVIGYHFGIPPLRGGFIGVDIFFVISGYLISGIIRAQVEARTFSVTAFYTRRFRRLIPASITVILLTTVLAALLFSPEMLAKHGKLSIMSAFSLANRELYFSSGYFDADAHTKPLLHMWSLSVEEQFYLVWPAVLLLSLRFLGSRITPVLIAVVTVLSAVACVYVTPRAPAAAFYLTPYRIFEFGLGALLLWLPAGLEPRLGRISGVVGGIGLVALACVLSADAMFPGMNALWVTLLSAALIHGSRMGPVSRVLRSRIAVFIGLISYALYLVHWPVFVFYRFIVSRDLTWIDQTLLVALTAGLAWALYTWVEQPFRWGRSAHTRPARLSPVAALIAAVVATGAVATASHGLPERARVGGQVPPTSDALEALQGTFCRGKDPNPLVTCVTGSPHAATVYVWGDSHANHLIPGMATVLPNRTVKFVYRSACNPLLGVSDLPYNHAWAKRRDCAKHNVDALTYLQSAPPSTVIIAGRWSKHLSTAEVQAQGVRALTSVRQRLEQHGHHVVIVGNVIEPGPEVIDCLRSPNTVITPRSRCQPFPVYGQTSQAINWTLTAVGPAFVDPTPLFCAPECRIALGRGLLFRDGHHLTVEGSTVVVQAVAKAAGL